MRSVAAAFYAISFFGLGADNVNFDNLLPGSLPPYWTATVAHPVGRGAVSPHWMITRDRGAPSHQTVFSQVATGIPNNESAIAVYDRLIARDADLSVKFKITGGGQVRSAGVVWRYQDQGDYYLLRFSVDESNIGLFRVQKGEPHPIPLAGAQRAGSGIAHELRAGQWYVAKVSYRGPHVKVSFGNRVLFDAEDSQLAGPGKTGLWTKAGTTAEFDDFRIDRKH